MKYLHPFPARMAPELALQALQGLPANSCVLDPMTGSGTVVRQASLAGHKALGFDLDPLAVLISTVSSRRVDPDAVDCLCQEVLDRAEDVHLRDVTLPWIDECEETTRFVSYWFGTIQKNALRRLAHALWEIEGESSRTERAHVDVLKVALSRIIITKDNGASLARDVSHSRPHRVRNASTYDVKEGFRRSAEQVINFLEDEQPANNATIRRGDARHLKGVAGESVDLVVTSPPYLNAIDYLRGHKLSLVWLGYSIGELRLIRSQSIGSERARDQQEDKERLQVESAMAQFDDISTRDRNIMSRYAADILQMMGEIWRVLKPSGQAVIVVGDNCVRGRFISNSEAIKKAASLRGLHLTACTCRDLPSGSRYLPIATSGALSKRMRKENVLLFCRAASSASLPILVAPAPRG